VRSFPNGAPSSPGWLGPAAAALAYLFVACGPDSLTGPLLDPAEQLARFDWRDNLDDDWFAHHVPFLETPDADIDATYYYRLELLTKHLVYGAPEHGYTLTEFRDRPFWSGTYGAISCPLGHQFYEIRWLKNPTILDDFARYWFEVPGAEPRSYSNWYADGVWAAYQVLGDRDWVVSLLPLMERQYQGWLDERWDAEHRMFRWDGMHDGMETNINSRQTEQWFDGAEGYRPTLNSYLWADATAIAKTHRLAGDGEAADVFEARAAALKARVQEELWDPERRFFFQQFAEDEPGVDDPWPGATGEHQGASAVSGARLAASNPGAEIRAGSLTYESGPWAGNPHGREAIGFVPWQFGLPDPGYEAAWAYVVDPERFRAPAGLRTTEKNDPLYYESPRCCVWSGNIWPYASAQTLTGMAQLLNEYQQEEVSAADWFALFRDYALLHRKEGRPYLAEAAHPETGAWSGHDLFFHSEHYLHSAFVDLAVTGLIGIRPQDDDRLVVNPLAPPRWDWFALDGVAYRGRTVTVVWDRTGARYGLGAGFSVFVNGERAAGRGDLGRLEVDLAAHPAAVPPLPPRDRAATRSRNFAVNNGPDWHPAASASSSHPRYPPGWAVDGQYWYHRNPPNRWLPDGAAEEDWFEVDFGAPRPVEEVRLYFLDDTQGLPDLAAEETPEHLLGAARIPAAPPVAYRIEVWDGRRFVPANVLRQSPPVPTGRRANRVALEPVATERLRVVLTHRPGTVAGLSELEAWGDAPLPLPGVDNASPNLARARPVRASHDPDGHAARLTDGFIAFNHYTDRQWTALGSPRASDWVEIALDGIRTVSGLDLYLWSWEARGTGAPTRIEVQVTDGASGWRRIPHAIQTPGTPVSMSLHRVRFAPESADRVRIVLHHADASRSGLTEIVVHGE
jgi:hypothetical protein